MVSAAAASCIIGRRKRRKVFARDRQLKPFEFYVGGSVRAHPGKLSTPL
jgi:hypothetical protein